MEQKSCKIHDEIRIKKILLKNFFSKQSQVVIVSSPSRVTAEENTLFVEQKESDDHEILRIYDGNNSLRNQVFRTISVFRTATKATIVVCLFVSFFCFV